MKYLMSKLLLAEDIEAFMREREGCEFVNEGPIWRFIYEAAMDVIKKLIGWGIRFDEDVLIGGIAASIMDDIDAIVCYSKDTERYGCFGKTIITVEKSEE